MPGASETRRLAELGTRYAAAGMVWFRAAGGAGAGSPSCATSGEDARGAETAVRELLTAVLAAAAKCMTLASISRLASGGGGIARHVAIRLRSRRASIRNPRTSGVGDWRDSRAIVSSSARSITVRVDGGVVGICWRV